MPRAQKFKIPHFEASEPKDTPCKLKVSMSKIGGNILLAWNYEVYNRVDNLKVRIHKFEFLFLLL